MKSYKKLIARGLVGLFALTFVAFGLASAKASAAQIPYVPGQPLDSPTTPAFNVYTNVPNGVGNEADFVRVRPSDGGVTNNGTSGERNLLYTDSLNATCNVGDKFDVRTYVHNGANADRNENGNGIAVAHNVTVAQTAPVNTNGKNFTFSSTISASNAATVSDTGKLNCASNVRLELVPSSVHVYSKSLGWNKVSDSAVNGSAKIGTHQLNSGDVWACWDERVLVAYTVKVVEIPEVKVPEYKCDLLTISKVLPNDKKDRRYKFEVNYTAKNGATFKDVTYDFGDGTSQTIASTTTEHDYKEVKTFLAKATVNFTVNGETVSHTSADCAKELTVTQENCPLPGKGHLPKDSPECKETLPETGAGSFIGLGLVAAVAGYFYKIRRAARQ